MRVLIFGSEGWIGNQFMEILFQKNIQFMRATSRADDYESVEKEIERVVPTHIVSFIGRTHGENFTTIDYLEQKGKIYENVRDNLFGPLNLALLSERKEIHYTYLGTGCIFSYLEEYFGKEENGFTEESRPNFFGSSYSVVKGFTDTMMSYFKENVLNLRIRMPITDTKNPRNFITKITSYEKICSIPNSMSVLPELLPIVYDMMINETTGTFNLTNPGLISHNEILEMYKEIVDPSFEWKNFTIEEQAEVLAADRSNNFLDTEKLESIYSVRPIKQAVRDCLLKYRHNSLPNIFITGGCGFIGSNFINYYFPENNFNKIVNLDAMYYCSNMGNVDLKIQNDNRYNFIKGNLRDRTLIKNILINYNITHVIHFAAQSHVDSSFNDSLTYTYDNIVGTHNLLEECRKYGRTEKIIHISTDEVYGGLTTDEEKDEKSILCPTNPYSATKAGAEMLVQSYLHSFDLPIIITRGNNVYGKNQYHEKVVPKFIKKLKENQILPIHGDGECVRDYIHISDTVSAIETIFEKGKIGEIYNIGCDDSHGTTVIDLAKLLVKKIKKTDDWERWIEYVQDRPFNDKRYLISNQKLKNLGWSQKISLEEGLDMLL